MGRIQAGESAVVIDGHVTGESYHALFAPLSHPSMRRVKAVVQVASPLHPLRLPLPSLQDGRA